MDLSRSCRTNLQLLFLFLFQFYLEPAAETQRCFDSSGRFAGVAQSDLQSLKKYYLKKKKKKLSSFYFGIDRTLVGLEF